MASNFWRVVGGADKGGILVRSGMDLTSAQLEKRLSYDAVVEQLSKAGDRLQYKLSSGTGPEEGWVSIKLKEKVLLQEEPSAAKDDEESRYIYIDFPSVHKIPQSIDELEKLAATRACTPSPDPDQLKFLDDALEDLLHLARDREKRNRIVRFLGSLLASLYVNANVKEGLIEASNAICFKLCRVSFASSMQDILWCPAKIDSCFVVLLCGFGGSHMDDLIPAVEEWSNRYGAHVLAFGPAVTERKQMLDVIFEKLMSLLEGGRQLVVHMCSGAGFSMFRALLQLWSERVTSGSTSIAASQVLRCLVSDCAGLAQGHKSFVPDGTLMEGQEEMTDKELNLNAQMFFGGCGINMFIRSGACKVFSEEPADSFGRAVGNASLRNVFAPKFDTFADGILWSDVQHILAGVPILAITSKKDTLIKMKTVLFFADRVRQIPGRKSALAEHWPDADEKILGEDGMAMHTHIFPKAAHCRAFLSDAAEYWQVVDCLVRPCMAAKR